MALAARESAASVRERQDGRTCDTQSDDRVTAGGGGGGLHVEYQETADAEERRESV